MGGNEFLKFYDQYKESQIFKNTVREMKNILDGLANRQDMAEERLSELDDIAIESLITKRQREQK